MLVLGVLADRVGDQLALGIFGAVPTALIVWVLLFGARTLLRLQPVEPPLDAPPDAPDADWEREGR